MSEERLSTGQRAVKQFTDRALALKARNNPLTFVDFAVRADAADVERRLRATEVGDLMLPDGASLSAANGGDYYPDLNLHIGTARVRGVGIRVWGWEYDKYRIDPNGPQQPPYAILTYPGEKDWARQVDIRIWYDNGKDYACQELTLSTSSTAYGPPSVSRDVSVPAYAETGYEGHNQVSRRTTNRAVLQVMAIVEELFAQRVVKPPARGGIE